MLILDKIPWLIHVPLQCSRELKAFVKLQEDIWQKIKENQRLSQCDSLTKLLLENTVKDKSGISGPATGDGQPTISDMDAGLRHLSESHFCWHPYNFNKHALYHQRSSFRERRARQGTCRSSESPCCHKVSLSQKSMMPYLRATILETLRQFPPTTMGAIMHSAREDTKLTDYGFIPKGTCFMINTWALHHDRYFWGDPQKFRPERFLDDNGELLPPDHPNRKRVLPSGAGPRVCLGEIFAMARLFLWTGALVKEFDITTADGADPDWMDPYKQTDDGLVLTPLPCDLIFTPAIQKS